MKKSASAAALALHSAVAGIGLFSPFSLHAQTTVTYTDTQGSATNQTTTVANPLTVTIASGVARENGVISGACSLTKTGAGTLAVDGSLASTAVTIAGNATLGGGGSIAGFTTLDSDAHLAPGNSPGTLTFTGGRALSTGTLLDFELGTTSDLIRVSGGTLSGPPSDTGTLSLTDSGGFSAGVYTLIDASGASLSSIGATSFELGTTIAGYTYTFGQSGDRFQLTAIAAAIPEPATTATLLGLAALVLSASSSPVSPSNSHDEIPPCAQCARFLSHPGGLFRGHFIKFAFGEITPPSASLRPYEFG